MIDDSPEPRKEIRERRFIIGAAGSYWTGLPMRAEGVWTQDIGQAQFFLTRKEARAAMNEMLREHGVDLMFRVIQVDVVEVLPGLEAE